MANRLLPTGTVTFLFTDIEGSTSLWQRYPEAMPAALSRHHALLSQAIETHHGYVFQIIGDAFCAAFPTALDGLNAAIDAQYLLRDEPWGETGPIRVRMGLHSGTAEVRVGDYTSGEYRSGLTLSRAARLLSAGHGGQVLLSLPSAELVQDNLPNGVELHDLGAHRLKDLIRPEHIYQAAAPGLPLEFPALKSLDARPHNLPAQLTSFIGRQREMEEIQSHLKRARLLTLVGPGGTGKTRLALQAAADLIDEFPDGAWFVDLSPLNNAELIPQAVAAVWGLREQPWRPIHEVLYDYLRAKRVLLVLDNCEHLAEASAQLSQSLLLVSAGLVLLATSREPLGVPGEALYRVPTLSLPDHSHESEPTALLQFEAVRLFVDRAIAARPDFAITPANTPAVVQICQCVDGIPLAIELAASRLRAFSVEQVAARIEDRFRLLTGGSRTSLPRQQTLRALIDWSYNLLSEGERTLFARLSVFQGGWTLETAEATCTGEGIDPYDIFDLLARLVDRSMVVVDEGDDPPRYRMLETLRQYASETLQEAGQGDTWRSRHLETYLKLAEEAEPWLRSGQDIFWLEQIEQEHDNLRTAIDTALKLGNTRAVLLFCAALHYFWYRRGHIQEGMKTMLIAISLPEVEMHPFELGRTLIGLGLIYWLNGSMQLARETLAQSIQLIRGLGNEARFSRGMAQFYLGITHMRLGEFATAQRYAEQALVLFEEIQDAYGLACCHYALGRIQIEQGQMLAARTHLEQAENWSCTAGDRLVIFLVLESLQLMAVSEGDFTKALALIQQGLEITRQMKDNWMISGALRESGNIAQVTGDYAQAASLFRESGVLSQQQGLLGDLARARYNQGYVAILQGDLPAGAAYFQESWSLFSQVENRRGQTEVLDGWAAFSAANGQDELAARLLGTADASFQQQGAGRWPVDLLEYQKLHGNLLDRLGEERFGEAYAAGQGLSIEQALEEVDRIAP